MAGTIGDLTNTYTAYYGDYGDSETYNYGAQTFVAAGDHLQSIDLLVDAYGTVTSNFHLLITTVKSLPGGEFQPDEILKEVVLSEPFDADSTYHILHVNLMGLELEAGQTYAFIIDGFVTKDEVKDALKVAYNDDMYDGGFAADLLVGTGRADDFTAAWNEYSGDYDLAFEAVFTDAGETIDGTRKNDRIDSSKAPKGQPKASDLDDHIYGNNGNDKLFGLAGFDYLNGGKGNDKLYGGNDGDVLVGGKGKDKLYGDDGEDCYVFDFAVGQKSAAKNFDKIYHFDTTEDAIYLDPSKFAALALGDLPDTDTHITYQNNVLFYDGIRFAQFKGFVPASLDDIHIVVAA